MYVSVTLVTSPVYKGDFKNRTTLLKHFEMQAYLEIEVFNEWTIVFSQRHLSLETRAMHFIFRTLKKRKYMLEYQNYLFYLLLLMYILNVVFIHLRHL
jgi:hypothetical protein